MTRKKVKLCLILTAFVCLCSFFSLKILDECRTAVQIRNTLEEERESYRQLKEKKNSLQARKLKYENAEYLSFFYRGECYLTKMDEQVFKFVKKEK